MESQDSIWSGNTMKSVITEDNGYKLLSTESRLLSLQNPPRTLTPAENLTLGEGREDRRLP